MLKEIIVLDAEVDTWEDALRVTYEELYKYGFVRESFYRACVERERIFPTGLPTNVPVAIPHTDPEHVIVPSVCVLRLKHPVAFVSMEDDNLTVQADYVFNMALLNAEDQVPMIQTIIETVQDSHFLERLKSLSQEEVCRLISNRWEEAGALVERKANNESISKETNY